ncbi:SAM-dependent chlorinase/fluorinase [Flavobacteriaceae bacterium]|jgi:S-adenosyl-L-methionine hydrolase (adenosine-forming)|nr:SAM-dependent chlorinase/fluorinase [Flavobacteriaceae bacterium]MDA9067580.1 SAM-dependent chlorinase/fluorinase [Flavobacteriaceae bacterium]MDB4134803.1 SAM-dependent chlorinase/fluorinase [Flavobacteriaceae bacterium]MDC1321183.1 SAM-dependent chlorinase/fluorinase [Flavobacteriaceae bacterium]
MPIITLTTDFGIKDHFIANIKGAILTELPQVNIVDISHQISPFNILEAAYIIQNSYKSFPVGTIHIIGVDSELNPENKHLVVKFEGQYFICADNGIMSMACLNIEPEKIVEINIHDKLISNFSVLDVFVKVACHISRGGKLEVIGKSIDKIKSVKNLTPFINESKNQIIGNVIYIDNYGNVITNITRSFFREISKSREFEISVRSYKFKKIHSKYSDIVNFSIDESKRNNDGQALAIFNSSLNLEIAIYKSNPVNFGTAASLMGLNILDTVTVNFK